MVDEGLEYLDNLERENKELKNKVTEYQGHISNTSFQQGEEGNLIQWQIDNDDILDKIEHFLRGDLVKTNEEGDTYFEPQTDKELVILNDYGVNSIMQILGNYVNKNIILSFYNEERINEILADLGDELALFLMCNYEKMGMDTNFKKSRYILLTLNILHIIESSFRRALFGQTMKEINSNTNIIQSENLGGPRTITSPKKRSFWNPFGR